MNRLFHILLILFFSFGLNACKKKIETFELPASVQLGEMYYTQVSLQHEKWRSRTTNYRRGFLIPVNTPVTLVGMDSENIIVRLDDSGRELVIENVEKHTNDTVYQAFDKLFAKTNVNLSKFNDKEREQIKLGKVAVGMSKEAVIVAIGYPPAHKTPSLDMDQWRYWSSRFNTFVVHFANNKVIRIQH